MGREPLQHVSGPASHDALMETCPSGDWERPCEDPADGCPGAWYRSEFIESFRKYRRNERGNPLVNRDTAPHIIEALFYFEHHHSMAQAAYYKSIQA